MSAKDNEVIRAALQAIISSPLFRNSKRYPAFLTYIVENTLRGDSEKIKERSIGIEVFGKPADYDTNYDPIVRNAASEIRKRLALYRAKHHRPGTVEITLPPGAYVPEFVFPSSPESVVPALLGTVEDGLSPDDSQGNGSTGLAPTAAPVNYGHTSRNILPLAATERSRPRRVLTGTLISVLILLAGLLCAWAIHDHLHAAPISDFWNGFTNTSKEVLVLVPEAPPPKEPLPPHWLQDNPNIAVEDAFAISRVSGILTEHHIPYGVRISSTVNLTDLLNRPLILIGGPSNLWTMRFLAPLRYHFDQAAIVDSEHPGVKKWYYEVTGPNETQVKDCAIVARFYDQVTGSTIMVIAGAGRSGTEAAGEFVTSPSLLSTLNKRLPKDWKDHNLEVILSTNVIGGKAGEPQIEATYSW